MTVPEVLFISPPDTDTREFRGAQPLGIAYLAAVLRQKASITSELLDANAVSYTHLTLPTSDLV